MALTDRQQQLLGIPGREQTLAIVGWLALANAFGKVTSEDVADFRRQDLPVDALHAITSVMASANKRRKKYYANRQQVPTNRKRTVRARKPKHSYALTTSE